MFGEIEILSHQTLCYICNCMGFIYKIYSPNNKLYVGQTRNMNQRISDYKYLRYRSKKSIIIASIIKYGWDAHRIEIIEEVSNNLLNEREMYWVKQLNTYYPDNPECGMNLTKGGDHRQEWREDKERVIKAKKRCGVNAPGYGKKLSLEVRNKISKSVSKYNILNNKKPSLFCYEKSKEARLRKIVCYDLNGDFVSEYPSVKDAAISLNIDRKTANDALNGKQYHGGGYIFKPKTKEFPLKIYVDKSKIHLKKRAILCLLNEKVLGEYATLRQISEAIGIKKGAVADAFFDNRKMRNGYRFIYKDLYEAIEKIA